MYSNCQGWIFVASGKYLAESPATIKINSFFDGKLCSSDGLCSRQFYVQ